MAENKSGENAKKADGGNGGDEELSLFSRLKRPPSKLDEAYAASRSMPLPPDAVLKPPKSIIEKAVDAFASHEGPYVSVKMIRDKPAIEVGFKMTF